jgi:NSS family neurotransmitter:Na+ symporter
MEKRENWGSRIGFIFAAAGSAIGLGNIWKFPYLAGDSGGAAFVFVYLLAVFFIGLTVMLAEFAIGRAAGLDAIGSFKKLDPGSFWWITGAMGVLAAFMILSFYGVVGGWSLAYFVKTVSGSLSGLSVEQYTNIFESLIVAPMEPIMWQLLFMGLTIGIVVFGIQTGIEKWSKILMPAIFIILLILIVRGLTLEGAGAGLSFYLKPDFSKINGRVILAALGQAFFSLSLGMGTMLTYGSYLSKKENLQTSALKVVTLDTLAAILAGLAIFPAVFATGLAPDQGPGLVFVILPAVFNKMPLGLLFGAAFFVLLAFAALTSAISILECVVAYLKDQLGWSRKSASIIMGGIITAVGVVCSLSLGIWSGYTVPFPGHDPLVFFDLMDVISSKVLLPMGGLLMCIFAGYVWKVENANKELTNGGTLSAKWLPLWNILVKYVAPIVIILVLLNGFGVVG